ncbi:MAG: glycosyl transferase, group 1 [Parcubacteria group bacterium Gr01-1014_44]|nr:MAG: glycosyl transferase, group 1 [Parcubacteria group bacterium Gr01-1014_44]
MGGMADLPRDMKKKILIVTGIYPPDIGGPASYVRSLAQKLSETSFVTVITYSSFYKHQTDREAKFKIIRIWKKMPWWWRHFIYAWKILWEAHRHDLIFISSTLNGGLPSLLAGHLFKKKVFVKIVGDYSWQVAVEKGRTVLLIDDWQKAKKSGWSGWLWYWQGLVVRKSDRVIVPSHYLAKLVEGWEVEPQKISVIYNGADFQPVELNKEEARQKIGIAGNIILYWGRLASWKGLRMLVKIMPQLMEINQFFRLVIIGSGPEEKNLQAMIRNMRLEKKVYLVGPKNHDELAVYLAAAEMFILNTAYEGFSHDILEAMLAGVPVITTPAGGNREIIHQGENGFLVKYNDEFNLIEAIKTIWNIPELRERFIKNGKETAAYFSAEKMLSKTIKLISQTIQNG